MMSDALCVILGISLPLEVALFVRSLAHTLVSITIGFALVQKDRYTTAGIARAAQWPIAQHVVSLLSLAWPVSTPSTWIRMFASLVCLLVLIALRPPLVLLVLMSINSMMLMPVTWLVVLVTSTLMALLVWLVYLPVLIVQWLLFVRLV